MHTLQFEDLKKTIIERLRSIDVDKLVLFGSYAYGTPNDDSDIDLYVVTNDDFIPKNFKEKNNLYLKVSRELRDLRRVIAIDLIVHTKQMHQLFKDTNSSFYRNDIQKGIQLI